MLGSALARAKIYGWRQESQKQNKTVEIEAALAYTKADRKEFISC